MRTERRFLALCAVTVGVLTIAWSAIFVRWAEMPGISSAFYRMLIAMAVLWPVLLLSRRRLRGITARTLGITAAGGIFFAGDVGLWNIAVRHTSAANATFLSNSTPLFVGLFTWMLTKRLPSRRFWISLLVALAGTGLIVTTDVRHALARSGADGLALLASVCFALYLVITGLLRAESDTVVLLTLSTTASAVALGVAAVLTHTSLAVPGANSWWALLGLGLLCQVGGYFGLTYALGHLPTPVTSILFLMVAPMTAVFAWIIFSERMGPLEIVGGLLLLVAVWVVGRREPAEMLQTEAVIPPVAQV